MKISTLAVAAAASASVAVASPHRHAHKHMHANKRTVTADTYAAGPTAYKFVLDDGESISVDEVCSGIASNKLKWGDNAPPGICATSTTSSSTTTATTTTAASTTTSVAAGAFYQQSSTTTSAAAAATGWSEWNSTGAGVDSPFPDGQLDCSTFPSQYGAVNLPYLGLGGWSGIQKVTFGVSAITNIVTGVSGDSCQEGDMCSYACPPGYQKAQWPSTQGATGQSVGGIQCTGGKLKLTNPGLSKNLCIPGMGGVQAQNNANGVVAICRTDYPGTESETVPVELQPGQTNQLTNPNAATYYTWQGGATSAQYYLNPIGVDAADGCQWGSPGSNKGNYAPINFGVGYKDGKTWLSIFQNAPTTSTLYQGTVELQGDLSAVCKYSNGQYCGATGCNSNGCTVAVNSGTATFVVSN